MPNLDIPIYSITFKIDLLENKVLNEKMLFYSDSFLNVELPLNLYYTMIKIISSM